MPYTFNNNFLKTYNLHSRLQIYEVILKFKFFFFINSERYHTH